MMNHSFFEFHSKEKINGLRSEGLMSQAFYRSRTQKPNNLHRLRGDILTILRFVIRKSKVENTPSRPIHMHNHR